MEITQDLIQELTSEKNYLYVDAYVGTLQMEILDIWFICRIIQVLLFLSFKKINDNKQLNSDAKNRRNLPNQSGHQKPKKLA